MKQRRGYATRTTKLQRERMKNDQCPICGLCKSKWKRRIDWRCCSIKCTKKFDEGHYLVWQTIRDKVLKRDNFTCVKCGEEKKMIEVEREYPCFKDFENKDYTWIKRKRKEMISNLIADHIIPIALGGDEWDLDNIQTLCLKCNKIKTKEDMKDIAKERRKEKRISIGQEELK